MLTPSDKPATQSGNRQLLGLQLFVGLIACAGALLIFGLLASSVINSGTMVQFDQNVEVAVHSWATPSVTQLFKAITVLGFQGLWVVVIIVGAYYAIKRRWSYLITWVAAFAGAELLNGILKIVIARPRPVFQDPLLTAANYSFPSGHAMISLVMYGLLAFFILLNIRGVLPRTLIIVATIILVLLIGLSRTILGVH